MKKIFITMLMLLGLAGMTNAQWVSPNEGYIYSMEDLINLGVVIQDGNSYLLMQDITISENDAWDINEPDEVILSLKNVMITINGYWSIAKSTTVDGDDLSKILFENTLGKSVFNAVTFNYLSGIKVVESDVVFNSCTFNGFNTGFTSAAVHFSNCNPEFHSCVFMYSQGAAIGSPANMQGSPVIDGCNIRCNGTANTNTPQINLGPGSDREIIIEGNTIKGGGYDMVGGISVSDLMGVGSTTVILRNNEIFGNRYGYNQQGYNISSIIEGNSIIENNVETNPMNGGSGISIYGGSTACSAVLRDNTIKGNLWGVTVINQHNVDMGTADEWGYNKIYENRNDSGEYDLYNNSAIDIMAVGNYWGTPDENEVETRIYHKTDDPSLGLVTFSPIWADDGVPEVYNTVVNDNRVYSVDGRYLGTEVPEDYHGVYIQNGKKYFR